MKATLPLFLSIFPISVSVTQIRDGVRSQHAGSYDRTGGNADFIANRGWGNTDFA